MDATAARLQRERHARIEAAWLTASLVRCTGQMPPLHSLLEADEPRDPEEVAAEQRAQMRSLNETLPKRTWAEWQQP